jgi:septal ring factor EnvC (AmiA/AmiB activator)
MAELAEAQRRTEQRVEELAEAQKRTEGRLTRLDVAMAELAEAHKEMEKALSKLADRTAKLEGRMLERDYAEKAYAFLAACCGGRKPFPCVISKSNWNPICRTRS